MAHPYADHAVHTLPSLVLRSLRDRVLKIRADVDREKLRHLSRLVGRAFHAGHDTMAVMPDYVACVAAALDHGVDWNETMEDVDILIRSFHSLSFLVPSTFDPGTGRPASPDALIAPMDAWIAARSAEADCAPDVADADIRAEMERVAALFPRVGLSYGYIGTCSNRHDDRGFMVFTQVAHVDGSRSTTTRLGDHSYDQLPALRTMALARLEAWARDLDQRIDAGTMLSRVRPPVAMARAA